MTERCSTCRRSSRTDRTTRQADASTHTSRALAGRCVGLRRRAPPQPRPANGGSLRGPGTLARAQTSSSTITSSRRARRGRERRPLKNNRTGRLEKALSPDAIYKIVRRYSADLGFEIGAHALRATAATNALDHKADIAKVQEWLGHANIATTRIYAHRKTRPEDSPTFKVDYR
jgi:hypothetical protein